MQEDENENSPLIRFVAIFEEISSCNASFCLTTTLDPTTQLGTYPIMVITIKGCIDESDQSPDEGPQTLLTVKQLSTIYSGILKILTNEPDNIDQTYVCEYNIHVT